MKVVIIQKESTYSAPSGEVGFEGDVYNYDVCIAEAAESYVADLNRGLKDKDGKITYKRTGRLVKVEYKIECGPDGNPIEYDI